MLRRIGGKVEKFGTLGRGGFVSVAGTASESKVTVLSDAAVAVETISKAAVEAELATAQAALAANPDDPYARDDVRWAELRLNAVDQQRAALDAALREAETAIRKRALG